MISWEIRLEIKSIMTKYKNTIQEKGLMEATKKWIIKINRNINNINNKAKIYSRELELQMSKVEINKNERYLKRGKLWSVNLKLGDSNWGKENSSWKNKHMCIENVVTQDGCLYNWQWNSLLLH